MADVIAAIEAALVRKGLSAAKASQLAVGHPSLIKNLRSGKGRFSYEALAQLANVLDLECYFGPPRQCTCEAQRLGPLLRARLRLDDDATEADALEQLAQWPESAHQAARRLVEARRREAQLAQRLATIARLAAGGLVPEGDAAEPAADAPTIA